MGGADIQNKSGIFVGLLRNQARMYKNVLTRVGACHLQGTEGIITSMRSHGLLVQNKKYAVSKNLSIKDAAHK